MTLQNKDIDNQEVNEKEKTENVEVKTDSEQTSEESAQEVDRTAIEIPAEETIAEETPTEEKEQETSEEKPIEEVPEEEKSDDVEEPSEEEPAEGTEDGEEKPEGEPTEGTEEAEENLEGEETEDELENPHPVKPYYEQNFLLFGQDDYLDSLDIEGTAEYLKGMGIANNSLEQARTSKRVEDINLGMYVNPKNKMFCNFCGKPIYGTEYEILDDGRKRCMRCSHTAIKTREEFQELFEKVKRNMEVFYSIRFDTSIQVAMANSKKIHRLARAQYDPNGGRILGFAEDNGKNKYKLYMENGSPRMSSIMTMAHEMTHIWQYTHWNKRKILKKYGKQNRLIIYEGMAKWAEIQYAYLINEPRMAEIEMMNTLARDDEYGYGFRLYYSVFGMSKKTYITGETPFMDSESPLGDIVI